MNSAIDENSKIISWGCWNIVWVKSDAIEEAVKLFYQGCVDGFGISPQHGFNGRDISFLHDIDGAFGVIIPFPEGFPCEEIISLKSLKFLTIGEKERKALDFSALTQLQTFCITWIKGDKLLKTSTSLKSIYIYGYSSKSTDLVDFPYYPELEKLELVRGNITSLSGIEKFNSLKIAEFYYMRNLTDITALNQCNELEELHFEVCKKITNIHLLVKCKNLRALKYIDCGEIQSLSILNAFKVLEFFAFVKTNVRDGDMTPLFRLKYAGFLNKRNYSHTFEQVSEIQQARSQL